LCVSFPPMRPAGTWQRCAALELGPSEALTSFDSYSILAKEGGLLRTGVSP
jgi:hypothetical protein